MNIDQLIKDLGNLEEKMVIMGIGIPGSGKTTVLTILATQLGIIRVSPDEIREELTGSQANQSVNMEAWDKTYKRVKSVLNNGQSVIVDATHAEAFRRPESIKLYRSFGANKIIAVYFNTQLDVAKRYNSFRDRVVSESVLERMNKQLSENPPSTLEGFDKVII